MAKEKKKRTKKYVPKRVLRDPMAHAIIGYSPVDDDARIEMLSKCHLSLIAFTQGRAVQKDWADIAGVINVGLILCDLGIGEDDESRAILAAAESAMLSVKDRFMRTQRLVFTGDEKKAVDLGVSFHEEQLRHARQIDVERAIIEVRRQLREKRGQGTKFTMNKDETEMVCA